MITKADIVRQLATMTDGSVLNFVMFEHGTAVFIKRPDDEIALTAAETIANSIETIGYFDAAKLKNHDAWIVTFCWGPSVMTDMRERKIVYRSWVKTE